MAPLSASPFEHLAGTSGTSGTSLPSTPLPMQSGDPRFQPTYVKAPRNARVMHITWADGHEGIYPHEILRGYCPCAGCQGHSGTIRFVPGGELEARFKPGGDLELRNIEQVGNYALRFEWGDAHDSGIYTFRYLRSLCQCAECVPADQADQRPERQRL